MKEKIEETRRRKEKEKEGRVEAIKRYKSVINEKRRH